MELIPSELIHILCDYLSFEDIQTLKILDISSDVNKSVASYLAEKVFSMLRLIFTKPHYDHLINFLKTTGSIISGSFILECLLMRGWTFDLDIYVPSKNRYLIQDISNKLKLRDASLDDDYPDIRAFEDTFGVISGNYIIRNSNRAYQLKIQFICTENPRSFVLNNFDLDICMNLLYFNDYWDVYIHSPKNIDNNTMNIIRDEKDMRVRKYVNRGFLLNVNDNNIKYVQSQMGDIYSKNGSKELYVIYKDEKDVNMYEYQECYEGSTTSECVIQHFFGDIKHKHITSILKFGYISSVFQSDVILLNSEY
jgi:hypothetical protein